LLSTLQARPNACSILQTLRASLPTRV